MADGPNRDLKRRERPIAKAPSHLLFVLAATVAAIGFPPSEAASNGGPSDSATFRSHLNSVGVDLDDTDTLIEGIGSPSELMRGACAWALGRRSNGRAITPLLEALNDRDARVRQWAVRSVSLYTDERVMLGLLDRLGDPDAEVRQWAVRGLAGFADGRVYEAMIRQLRDEDAEVRQWSVRVLSRSEDESIVDPLIRSLTDPDAEVREWSVSALSRFDEIRVRKALRERLDLDGDAQVREQAARALGLTGSFGSWSISSRESLLPPSGDRENDLDPQTVRSLIDALGSSDADVRESAVRGLAKVRDEEAIEGVIDALEDESAGVREWAVRTLGSTPDERFLKPLIDRLGDEEPDVRQWAVRALGASGDMRAEGPLRQMLSDPDPDVARWAERALEDLGC